MKRINWFGTGPTSIRWVLSLDVVIVQNEDRAAPYGRLTDENSFLKQSYCKKSING